MNPTYSNIYTGDISLNIYHTLYYNLCESKKQLKPFWKPGSGLHRHHIVPVHSGGNEEETNFTYLTTREHKIAHFLLWKMNGNPNDLRSMKMLGANLSIEQRRIIGEYCRDNNIGFFAAPKELKDEWRRRGIATSISNKIGIHDPVAHKEYARLGGKAGAKSQIESKTGIHNPENFSKNASLGGKSLKGMICVTNGMHRTRIQPEKLEEFLSKGYVKGFTISS